MKATKWKYRRKEKGEEEKAPPFNAFGLWVCVSVPQCLNLECIGSLGSLGSHHVCMQVLGIVMGLLIDSMSTSFCCFCWVAFTC